MIYWEFWKAVRYFWVYFIKDFLLLIPKLKKLFTEIFLLQDLPQTIIKQYVF